MNHFYKLKIEEIEFLETLMFELNIGLQTKEQIMDKFKKKFNLEILKQYPMVFTNSFLLGYNLLGLDVVKYFEYNQKFDSLHVIGYRIRDAYKIPTKPIEEFTEQEDLTVISYLCKKYPDLLEIKNKIEIKL